MTQGLSTPDPSLSHTQLSIRGGRATTTHYTHYQISLMVSRNTILVPSPGLRIGPACAAGLSADMRRQRVPPQRRKKKERNVICLKRFTRYGHYAGEAEDIVVGRLAVVS